MELVLELEIPARPEFIAIARLVVASLASSRRALADDRIDDLKLAVSEACTNAIEAHGAAESDEHVRIRVWEGDERMEVAVEDRGAGFDVDSLPAHPPVTDPTRLNFERGLGIPLIRSLVDDVEFHTSSEGTSVRMTLYGGPAEMEPPVEAPTGELR
jgi:serine/threonine-protein kinase RsbW